MLYIDNRGHNERRRVGTYRTLFVQSVGFFHDSPGYHTRRTYYRCHRIICASGLGCKTLHTMCMRYTTIIRLKLHPIGIETILETYGSIIHKRFKNFFFRLCCGTSNDLTQHDYIGLDAISPYKHSPAADATM